MSPFTPEIALAPEGPEGIWRMCYPTFDSNLSPARLFAVSLSRSLPNDSATSSIRIGLSQGMWQKWFEVARINFKKFSLTPCLEWDGFICMKAFRWSHSDSFYIILVYVYCIFSFNFHYLLDFY